MSAYTYILLCSNGEYYVGSTDNIEERLKRHQAGFGCAYTKAHRPVELVYKEEYDTIEQAYQRERQLHKWSHQKKDALIKGNIGLLKELSKGRS